MMHNVQKSPLCHKQTAKAQISMYIIYLNTVNFITEKMKTFKWKILVVFHFLLKT